MSELQVIPNFTCKQVGERSWLVEHHSSPRFLASIVEPAPGAFLDARLLWIENGASRDLDLESQVAFSLRRFLATYESRISTLSI